MATAPPLDERAGGRVPPHDIEAEQSVLGAVLLDELAIFKVSEWLRPEDFYRRTHGDIYRAQLELVSQSSPTDIVTVGAELEKMGVLERVGGRAYLAQLEQSVPTAANIEYYGRIVKEKATKRGLISAGGDIAGLGYDEAVPSSDALNQAQKVIFDLSEDRTSRDFFKLFGLLRSTMERIDTLQAQGGGGVVGIPTGFYDFDAKTMGLKPNELIIVAGRPSMGKCVAGHTLIDDPLTGERLPIERWVAESRPTVLGVDAVGHIRQAEVSAWVDSGVKPVFRVRTRLGREVVVTGHHPFLTLAGWRRLDELRLGEQIAVPRRVDCFGSRNADPDLVRLLGYFIAEGGLTHTSPAFTNTDPEVVADFEGIIGRRFPELKIRRDRITYFPTGPRGVGGWRNPVTGWLRSLGLMGKRAEDKYFPDEIWTYDRGSLALFLRVVMSCDGTIYSLGGHPRIEFAVASERLARDMQHALTRFGIVAKLWRKKGRCWRVEITEPSSVVRYQKEIGWIGEKAGRFPIVREVLNRPGGNIGHPGVAAWAIVKEAAESRSVSLAMLTRAAGETVAGRRGFNPHIRRGIPQIRLAAYAGVLDTEQVHRLASPDLYWDEIVAIEDAGEDHVFDLTVPEGANFIAADVVVHNTSLALNLCLEASVMHQKPVAIFSLEMSRDQIAERLLCEYARIDAQRLHRGLLGEGEVNRLAAALGPLGEAPVYIDDTPALDELQLLTKARRAKLQYGIQMVVIDYIQLMRSRSGGGDDANRVQEVSTISRAMKALARELEVPVIALSQLNRAPEQRTDKRPMLSDLRESGCLPGDTRIFDADTGGYVEIKDLVERRDFSVLGLNEKTWQLERRPITNAFSTGVKTVFRLTTRLGRSIRATANHPFRTFSGWSRLDALSIGTHIALPRVTRAAGKAQLTQAELALLGHLIGDGCTLPRHALQYTTREPELAKLVAGLAEQVFGDSVRTAIVAQRSWFQVFLGSRAHLTHGVRNPIARWLDGLGVFGLRSEQKRVPEAVFTTDESGISTFLRHLWATDGCIHLSEAGNLRPVAYYATSSQRLARDVQSLLLRFAINARLTRVPQSRGRDQFHVVVTGKPDLMRFLDSIGAVGQRRLAVAAEIRRCLDDVTQNPNRDVIPKLAWRQLAVPAMALAGVTAREMQAAIGTRYCGSTLYKTNISRERAARVAGAVNSVDLLQIALSDVYWDEVVSIVPDGEEETFDLTVDGLHNFVAQDFIVHNSIEQDADIVVFLYREAYYNKADTSGIAEVIVAKNRNGPVGTVNLKFIPELTRFENLDMRHRTPAEE